MKLSELLREDRILLPLGCADKWQAITLMAQAMVGAKGLAPEQLEVAKAALVAREKSMTTGMEGGIAIPHAAVDDLEQILAVLAIAPEGIQFEALDGEPGRILICLLIPRAQKLQHIRTLAEIAKLLSRQPVRQRILACESAEEVLSVIAEAEEEA